MKQFTRKEINKRLKERIARKEPIILGGAGIGLVAKVCDRAGIDIIMAYNTGPFRMDGAPSASGYLAYGDSNGITLELGRRVLKQVNNTPVIGGIGAGDPYRDIGQLIEEMMVMGFSGITNVPTAGCYTGTFRTGIDATHCGYPEEVKLVADCNKRDIFTVAYAFDEEEIKAMVGAGVDIVSPHVRVTSGGTVGFEDACRMDEAIEKTQRMYEAAVKENPDVIVVCHGGPFETPADVKIAFERTKVHGFIGASSMERLPVEKAVAETVRKFKGLKLR